MSSFDPANDYAPYSNFIWAPQKPPKFHHNYLLHLALFLVTLFTTTLVGGLWFGRPEEAIPSFGKLLLFLLQPQTLKEGLFFSLPLMFILFAHEMGHYLTCRFYDIDATLPYFIPAPVGIGTFGAIIRIKERIYSKKLLFDIGVMGPIAGFLASLPFVFLGIQFSTPEVIKEIGPYGIMLGNPLLFALVTPLYHTLDANTTLLLHPFAFAGWIGCLVTALNLLPFGQLDGGHILYAVLGHRHYRLVLPLFGVLLFLGFFWPVWLFWAAFIFFMGLFHPPVLDEHLPLDSKRKAVAFLVLVMFVLTFMPVPIQ